MSLKVRSAGIWRDSIPYVKAAGTWKIADYVWNKQSGKWYTSFIKGGLIDKSWDSLDQTGYFGTKTSSTINGIAFQSDGKIVIGGNFINWNGISAQRIARLNSDGTLDTAFTTNNGTGANTTVHRIAVQSDGKILVGGGFTSWNGTTVGYIVRLNSDGTLDTTFTTNNGTGANANIIHRIAVQSDGKILVGGGFTSWNGTTVGYIVRLNSDGTRDTTFSTNNGTGANSEVYSVAVQSDGKILLGGFFSSWNGTTVGRIVRLNSDGTRDTAFSTNNGTGANSATIVSVAVQSDGKILLGGTFTTWNGTTVGGLVRLDSGGTLETTFTTNVGTGTGGNSINSIAFQSDGKIVLVGTFSTWNGTTVNYIVRLNSDGTRDTAFTTNTGTAASNSINSVTVRSDGKIIVGGGFTTWNGEAGFIVLLNSDGTNETLSTFANAGIQSIAIQSDGKILVGGQHTTWNGTTVGRIVRLNSDGTRDTAFSTNNGTGANTTIVSIAVQSDGKILLGGNFTSWNGTTVGYIVRLNSDGTLDTTFTTNNGTGANVSISAIAVQSDGKILLGGTFTSWNGTTVGRIVRLNSDGTRDTAFTTNNGTGANNSLNSIAIQSDGKILVGGQHTTWNGTTVGRIVRLNSDGTRDTAFSTNNGTGANGTILPIAVQSDGKILVGGFGFTSWNGTTVGYIVRLNSDGTRDTAFTTNNGTGANGSINAIAFQSDGKIVVGGGFTIWNGTAARRIVRLNSDGILDTPFTSNTEIAASSTISAIAVQSDGKILLGGFFTTFKTSTQFRRYFVRIGGEIA